MNPQLSILNTELTAFCQAHGIRRLAIFGSALQVDFSTKADIDVLVELAPERASGLLGIARMEIELSVLFGGRKLDLRTPEDLSRYFCQDVLDTAEVQYAQG